MSSINTVPGNQAIAGSIAAKGFKFRDQRRRYPWWVKSVDKMTTETDDSVARKPGMPLYGLRQFQKHDEHLAQTARGYNRLISNAKANVPGWRIQDIALNFAAGTYFAGGYTLDGKYYDGMEKIAKIVSVQVHPPDKLGIPRWEGCEEEASDLVETAAIHLGAAQVGYAAVNPLWLPDSLQFDSSVDAITVSKDWKTLVPERYKYVIVMVAPVPQAAAMRATSLIGGAADRVGFEGSMIIRNRVRNFIKGLGYDAMFLPIPDNPLPFAVAAGIGEIGRMNRLISPLYGGALRISGLITDLPLALDKPIDFRLQEFCRHCKLCAEACPANVISIEDEPSWTPKDEYGLPGKKVWFEYGERCHTFGIQVPNFCGACMSSCCWTKENTWFHNLMRVFGSKMPFASGVMAYFEKAFGYGVVPEEKRNRWWKLKLPIKGIDSFNVRRAR